MAQREEATERTRDPKKRADTAKVREKRSKGKGEKETVCCRDPVGKTKFGKVSSDVVTVIWRDSDVVTVMQ